MSTYGICLSCYFNLRSQEVYILSVRLQVGANGPHAESCSAGRRYRTAVDDRSLYIRSSPKTLNLSVLLVEDIYTSDIT